MKLKYSEDLEIKNLIKLSKKVLTNLEGSVIIKSQTNKR